MKGSGPCDTKLSSSDDDVEDDDDDEGSRAFFFLFSFPTLRPLMVANLADFKIEDERQDVQRRLLQRYANQKAKKT